MTGLRLRESAEVMPVRSWKFVFQPTTKLPAGTVVILQGNFEADFETGNPADLNKGWDKEHPTTVNADGTIFEAEIPNLYVGQQYQYKFKIRYPNARIVWWPDGENQSVIIPAERKGKTTAGAAPGPVPPAAGPKLKRGVKKEPEKHKPSKVKEVAREASDAVFGEGKILGSTKRKLWAFGLGVGLGLGWCGIDRWRTSAAEGDAAEKQAFDEKEKRENPVDQFTFKAKVQMVGNEPIVNYSTEDLRVDQCISGEGHSLTHHVGALENAGEGFLKFKISIDGTTHGKPVKYDVAEEVFADGAEREYELTAHRVDVTVTQ